MVDVSEKASSQRSAVAKGEVHISTHCRSLLDNEAIAEICSVARIAGIQAGKKTSELIPLCHQINLSKVSIDIKIENNKFLVSTTAKTNANTGVEMEALVAAQISCATIYDMVKAHCPEAIIGPFQILEKVGGKTGHWTPS